MKSRNALARQWLFPFLASLLCALPSRGVAFTDECNTSDMGCSIELAYAAQNSLFTLEPFLLAFYGNKFNSACVRHDYCYRHGAMTYDKSKSDCDNEFFNRMNDKCEQLSLEDILTGGVTKVSCFYYASAMYGGVVAFGGFAFRTYPDDGCCEYDKRYRRLPDGTWEEYVVPATTEACGGTIPFPASTWMAAVLGAAM